ncbi:unnamed protein product, partial [marine sediment metagenome]
RMAEWIDIAGERECPPGTSIERVAANEMVALANVDGQYTLNTKMSPT